MADDLRYEQRWLDRNGERVLQYRQQFLATQYSSYASDTGEFIKIPEWGPWIDVPVVTEGNE
jgi:hypothetical protein